MSIPQAFKDTNQGKEYSTLFVIVIIVMMSIYIELFYSKLLLGCFTKLSTVSASVNARSKAKSTF